MLTSCTWLNDYLDPPATPEEQAKLLTNAGFPLESTEAVEDGDVRQDYEMTSNRGDCVSHIGLAREIAAISGRNLKIPRVTLKPDGPEASDLITVRNDEPELCPLYTARVIRGIKVGPSPDWLARRLRARGDIPRNNVVDATNFVQFEWGQPTHVFDLNLLEDRTIIIRRARAGELFLPLGEGEHDVELTADDLVIADASRAVALAGVKGGALTAVTGKTTDILIEAATFNPVSVRTTSRRHNIASDSSYRFERGVHPGQISDAADRLVQLILETAGGELCAGTVLDGKPLPERKHVSMRMDRCRKILGIPIPGEQMVEDLKRLGFEPKQADDRLDCVVPIHRLDIEREIDLIEEVGRMHGHDVIPIRETIEIRVAPPQPVIEAQRAVRDTLVGLGYLESITHSLIDERSAHLFMTPDMKDLRVDDDRAKAWPVLRPSVLPSLLKVRALNKANGVDHLKLFESASTFWRTADGHREVVKLGLLADTNGDPSELRRLRGDIERIILLLCGPGRSLEVRPDESADWFATGASISLNGSGIGQLGVLSAEVIGKFGLDHSMLAAELELSDLYDRYPPDTEAQALPAFPAIARDVSAILEEPVNWGQLRSSIEEMKPPFLEAIEFITVFRGKPIEPGRKSLTFQLRFRAPDRTLTHDEVDPQMAAVMEKIKSVFNAEIRS